MIRLIKNSELDNKKLSEIKATIDNRLDNFDFSKVVVRKPWGYEYLTYKGENASIWTLFIKHGAQTSMHCHLTKKTILLVVLGKAQCSTLNDVFNLEEGDGLILDKKVFHSTHAISKDKIILLEIETPPRKTDLVRAHDKFGRELKGYELQNEMCFDLSEYERVFLNERTACLHNKIGKMNINIHTINNNVKLHNYLRKGSYSVNVILSGDLINKENGEVLSVGDIIKLNDPKKVESIKIIKPVKVLHITKDVSDFD